MGKEGYLEPFLATAVAAAKVSGTFVHPYHDWSLLMRPLLPVCTYLAASCYFGAQVGRCAAVTHDLFVVD